MSSEDYEKQVKAKGDVKRFDFIHMIQVLRLCISDGLFMLWQEDYVFIAQTLILD